MIWMELLVRFRTIMILLSMVFPCLTLYACGGDKGFNFKALNADNGYNAPREPYVGDPSVKGVRLSGYLVTDGEFACDWDVNDPEAPYQSNDRPEDAQHLTAPVTVGGFVRWSDAGLDGRLYENWDAEDYYAVTLSAGDTIEMVNVDQSADGMINVELRSADDPARIIDSFSPDEKTFIEVKQNSDYLIHVSAYGGAFSYLLDIGSPSDDVRWEQSGDAFVPGEAIIQFKNEVLQEDNAPDFSSWALQNKLLSTTVSSGQSHGSPLLMRFKTVQQKETVRRQLNLPEINTVESLQKSVVMERENEETLAIIAALNRRSDVAYAEPNYIRKLSFVPNDEYYPFQWHYKLIGLEAAWDITSGSPDVVVAVVDSGVRFDHPDLSSKFTDDGFDFVSNTEMSLDGDGIDSDPTDPGDNPEGDSQFHGTHVAGTVAAVGNNGIGVAGVGGRTRVMPMRTFGLNGEGTVYDILQAVRYAAGMSNSSGQTPHSPADIINLSIGGTTYSQSEADLFEEIIFSRNIVVVAAAGNESRSISTYPASYPGVISVSAVDFNARAAPYSNYGDHIDVAAPGGNVYQDVDGDGWSDGVLSTVGVDDNGGIYYQYRYYQGTSMATPHVAGVVGLMKAVRPELTSMDVLGWLAQGNLSTDLGTVGWDAHFGYGLINAYRAVLTAENEPQPEAGVILSPNRLNFFNGLSEATLKLTKIGDGELNFSRIDCNAQWVRVDAVNVDDEYMGTYRVRVDRTHSNLIEAGRYDTTIAFVFDQQTLLADLSLLVGDTGENPGGKGYIGHLYVLLVDGDTNATRYGVAAEYSGSGRYRFEFDNVPSGRYKIVAGSNRDYDGRIGESGEALGVEEQDFELNKDLQLDHSIKIDFNAQ